MFVLVVFLVNNSNSQDLDTFLIVVTDPNSDNYVQKMVDRFLAKVFRPLKVSWIKLVNF